MSECKPVLSSAANPTIRHLLRMRDNRARRKARRVIVDGWSETAQAIDAGLTLCGIYLPEAASREAESQRNAAVGRVLDAVPPRQISLVSESLMEKIGYGQSFRGVVAEFEQPSRTVEQLELPPSPVLLLLDEIEKPGNVGAVFRCADAAGIDAVLLADSCDLFNPNAIRSSLGSVFHVRSAQGTQQELEQFLDRSGIRVLAARVESSVPLWSADLAGPLAIVLGSEAEGLGDRWRKVGDRNVENVCIPMAGKIDSLNISVAAAVMAFEVDRRRRDGPLRR
jgi:TrmH family RNA methyltransferase